MGCCCNINAKGVIGIVFGNVAFALLLLSFLSCNWLTKVQDNTTQNATMMNAGFFSIGAACETNLLDAAMNGE